MSRTNETRHTKCQEICTCKYRLDASVCNNKQRWNEHKCRCECKKWIDKSVCNKGFIWNPSNCECELDKSCDVGEYLDYRNGRYRKRLVDKLVEECSEYVDEVKMAGITLFEHGNVRTSSGTIYVVLIAIIFTISTYWYLKKDVTRFKFGTRTQKTI